MQTTIPTITTARLDLRPFTPGDEEALHRMMHQPDVMRYFPTKHPPSRERVQRLIASQLAHWAEHGYGWWAVEPRAEQRFIGWCGLQYLPDTDETEVAYHLDKDYWGQGLATEGAWASLEFGFDRLGLETIVAIVMPGNAASRRVIEKLGMGAGRRQEYFGVDCLRHELDRASFEAARASS